MKTIGLPFLVQDADAVHISVGLVVLWRIPYYVVTNYVSLTRLCTTVVLTTQIPDQYKGITIRTGKRWRKEHISVLNRKATDDSISPKALNLAISSRWIRKFRRASERNIDFGCPRSASRRYTQDASVTHAAVLLWPGSLSNIPQVST